jgi:tetratricopeptide (TPR) repeat protein
MKKINLLILLAGLLLGFSISSFAQKSNAPAEASALMSQGKFKDAIAVLDQAVAKNQDLYMVYKMRASLKRMMGDFAGALSDFSAALELKAEDGELYEQRAMMRLYTRGDASLILADLDAAISYGRKHEKVYSTRAMIRGQLRDFAGAVADYETAIGMRPDFAGAYIGLSSVYGIQRNEAKAAEILEKFIAMIENSDAPIEPVKGKVIAASGANQIPNVSGDKNVLRAENSVIIEGVEGKKMTREEAEASVEKLEQTRNIAGAYASLASIYHRRKDLEKASEMVEKALKIDPSTSSALLTRGEIRTAQGKYADAIGDLDAALRLMPNYPPAFLARGIARMLAGNEAESQQDFDKFLQLYPAGKAILDKEIEKAKQKKQP